MYWITQMAVHTIINIQTNTKINKMIGPSEQAIKSRKRNNRIRQIGSCKRALREMLRETLNKYRRLYHVFHLVSLYYHNGNLLVSVY